MTFSPALVVLRARVELQKLGNPISHDGSTAALPASVASLLDTHSEGVLSGSLELVAPGSTRWRAVAARFEAARVDAHERDP